MKILIRCGLFLIALILVSGCTGTRKALRAPLKEQGAEYLIHKLKQNELKYCSLSAKFTATFYRNKKKTNLSGQLRIKHDSIIWISVTPILGIEMARFELTPDSIKFLNRMNSTYMAREFKYINQLLNKTLDFDMAQAFITGNDFSLYDTSLFKALIDNQEYKLMTSNRHKLKRFVRRSEKEISIPLQSIWLDPESFKITRVLLKEAERDSRKFLAEYNEFLTVSNQSIPIKLDYQITTDKEKIRIKIDFSKIQLDEKISFPFSIPETYTEMEIFKKTE